MTRAHWHCVRCGWDWHSRGPGKPLRCGRCKITGWDRPARVAAEKPKPKRSLSLYGLDGLEVGRVRVFAWPANPAGNQWPGEAATRSMHEAIRAAAKRRGWTIRKEGTWKGLEVTRLS